MAEWYEEMFTGAWVDAHVDWFPQVQSEVEAEQVVALLGLRRGDAVLDVPCGEGRHSLHLASLGLQVTGVDLSEGLLERGRQRARERGLEVEWVHQDMRAIRYKKRFHGALCMWGSFGYFDDRDNAAFLREVSASLRKGGGLILDLHTVETLMPMFTPRSWHQAGEVLVLERRTWDPRESIVHTEWRFVHPDHGEVVRHSAIRLYAVRQLLHMLEYAGFSKVDLYGSLAGELYSVRSRRLVLVARR